MHNRQHTRLNKDPTVLSGFSRTLPELQWLLLSLVLFYYVVGNVEAAHEPALLVGAIIYAALNLVFQYVNFFREPKEWKLAIQTWVMIIFISFIMLHTGEIASPLVSLYLLPVVASAITSSRLVTLLQTTLIGVAILYFNNLAQGNNDFLSLSGSSEWLMIYFPMMLVAYVITMLSSDIQKGFNYLKTASETDELTKLFNRRTLLIIGNKLLGMSERRHRPLSVLMIDVDKLKPINDKFGHEAGSLLLISISQSITSVLREQDIAARYGGDEFIVLLPDCPQENAKQVAERMVERFKRHGMKYQGKEIELSASIGISNYPEHAATFDDLINKADAAMYMSKRKGQNLIHVYEANAESKDKDVA